MPSFDEQYASFRVDVQASLDAFMHVHGQQLLDISGELAPALESLATLLSGGKRLRPACSYWGYLAAGGRPGPAIINASASLELLQASALIHDDVMDHSDSRRGLPAVHRQFEAHHQTANWHGAASDFGAAAAILIGDLALVWSDAMLFESGFDDDALRRAKQIFDIMRTELMAGQFLDVAEQARGGGSVDRALRVMRYKTTAYTIERPLHLGAALAGASAAVFEAFTAFGIPLGEAFQLRDDVLGVFGDPTLTGKPAGDDVREGKRTVLIALAQESATPAQAQVLDAFVGDKLLDDAGLETVQDVLRDTGALAEVESRISRNRDAALAALDDSSLHEDGVIALKHIALAATDRDF